MPIIKSAKKRVKVAHKATVRNSKTKRSLKSAVKNFGKALEASDKKKALKALDKVQSELDKATLKLSVLVSSVSSGFKNSSVLGVSPL